MVRLMNNSLSRKLHINIFPKWIIAVNAASDAIPLSGIEYLFCGTVVVLKEQGICTCNTPSLSLSRV
ncbi:hypothetical protein PSCICL_16730 [Pseudomonas cichorii]|nr:hypothetical protein PSCICF_40930 [Pseudomonas cichorii]GFM60338.1 hypothetical protein PSCICG_14980 [Pseudomonas cichorii]GFM70681.1 hypothetical protein PSCICL_16730 [Pseudomonas cichorii]